MKRKERKKYRNSISYQETCNTKLEGYAENWCISTYIDGSSWKTDQGLIAAVDVSYYGREMNSHNICENIAAPRVAANGSNSRTTIMKRWFTINGKCFSSKKKVIVIPK